MEQVEYLFYNPEDSNNNIKELNVHFQNNLLNRSKITSQVQTISQNSTSEKDQNELKFGRGKSQTKKSYLRIEPNNLYQRN